MYGFMIVFPLHVFLSEKKKYAFLSYLRLNKWLGLNQDWHELQEKT